MRLRSTVHLAEPHKFQANRPEQVTVQVTEQDEAQVQAQVAKRILQECAVHPLSSAEIAVTLDHKTLSGNERKALPALRDAGLLENTIPDKPTSRLQKYRLTGKGRAWIEGHKDGQ